MSVYDDIMESVRTRKLKNEYNRYDDYNQLIFALCNSIQKGLYERVCSHVRVDGRNCILHPYDRIVDASGDIDKALKYICRDLDKLKIKGWCDNNIPRFSNFEFSAYNKTGISWTAGTMKIYNDVHFYHAGYTEEPYIYVSTSLQNLGKVFSCKEPELHVTRWYLAQNIDGDIYQICVDKKNII